MHEFWEHLPVLLTSIGTLITTLVSAYLSLRRGRALSAQMTAVHQALIAEDE